MTVAIVTDSGSDLTPQLLAENNIRQVPLTVSFADRSFLCPDELSPDEFWKRMTARGATPMNEYDAQCWPPTTDSRRKL